MRLIVCSCLFGCDLQVLQSFKIMDYSLLLGVHHITSETAGSALNLFNPSVGDVMLCDKSVCKKPYKLE